MRGFLKLSMSSPVPALHFLLGELTAEAHIHIQTLSLFHNLWANPDITVFELVKFILRMCRDNSTTWSNHVQILCKIYSLPCPLYLIEHVPAWPKEKWTTLIKTRVTVHHETKLWLRAKSNSKMCYLNVQLLGLSGHPHPALLDIFTTQDVRKLRLHIKFLAGDFLTAERVALDQPQLSPMCKLCGVSVETTSHVLVQCRPLSEVRERLLTELLNVVSQVQPSSDILNNPSQQDLTQFILDCTSPNLNNNTRVPAHNPDIKLIFRVSRDWCFAISNKRLRLLQEQKSK